MTMRPRTLFRIVLTAAALAAAAPAQAGEPWTKEKANEWYRGRPVPIGCNFAPSSAINQLEMWQAETFDLPTIDRELGWAEDLGFNSVRVFLHDLPWKNDRDGFLRRIEQFLQAADRHKISVLLVPLDGVWDPFPRAGKQPEPKPGLHNSGWVQSPGLEILKDPSRHGEVESYIKGVVGHFRDDRRVLAWDLFNEPDNPNKSSYGRDEPTNKPRLAVNLLKKVFAWAREAGPTQPLTSGVWLGDWTEDKLSPINRLQLEESDVVSFHDYSTLTVLKARVASLRRYGRPLLCTEYMARPNGSTFDPALGYLREERIGAYNWGFVSGKSQTIYPWDSWQKPYPAEPRVWFHDIFRADGTPFDPKEVAYIKRVTGKTAP